MLLQGGKGGATMTQPRDNTGKEELVEEIVDYVHRVLLNTERASSLRLDRHDPEAQGKRLRTDAEDAVGYLITLISQAIAEGKVKLPGEIDRTTLIQKIERHLWWDARGYIDDPSVATEEWYALEISGCEPTHQAILITLSPAERKEGTEEEK